MTIVTIEIDGSGAIVLRGAEDVSCPITTQNIAANLEARDSAINIANYGPLDPTQENADYWGAAADRWNVSVEEVKTARCGNCAAFNVTSRMRACIAGGVSGPDTWLGATDLGYCEVFGFKCASARRCDAWVQGGPLTDELEQSMQPQPGDEDEYDEAAQATKIAAPGWMRANARRGIEWVNEGEGGDGLTPQTMREARAMAGGSVSDDKAMRMAAWFARHMMDLDAPAATVGADGYPSPGVVAHALWGGGSKTDSKRAAAWARAHRNGAAKASTQPRMPAGSSAGGQFGSGGGGSAGAGGGATSEGGAASGTSDAQELTDREAIKEAVKDVDGWRRDNTPQDRAARTIARGALSEALDPDPDGETRTFVKRGADGKVVAVSSIQPHDTFVKVETLAVNPAASGQGIGRQMMSHAAGIAVTKKQGIELAADPGAVGFYKAIGMKAIKGRSFGFAFTAQAAAAFAASNPQKATSMSNAEIDSTEPRSGLFTVPDATKASTQPRVPAGSSAGGQFGAGGAGGTGGGTGVAGDGGAGGGTSEPKQITDEAEIQQAEEDVANWPNDGSYEQDMAQSLAMGSLSDALTGEMMPAMTYVKRGADGKVVAVSQIDGESKTRVTVNYLAVSPASQGQGLGRQMMAHATEIAVEQGKGLSLSPISSAVPFYEKIGMQLAPAGARDEGTMSFSKMRAKEFFMRNPQKAARGILNAEIDSLEPVSGLFAIPGETKASTQPRMPAGSRQGGQFGAGGGGAGGTGTAARAFKAGQDEEINDALKQEQGAYIDALTKDQARSVSDYQQIETYEEVNGGLRGATPLSPESQTLVANLDSTIAGASMGTSTTVFRGVVDDSGALEQLKVGDTILEKAYSSTSPNPAVAEAFANDPYSSEGKPYVLQIEVPAKHPAIAADVVSNKLAGRDLVQTDPMTVELTGYTRLNEVILPRNLGMTVTAITKKESATYIKVSITK